MGLGAHGLAAQSLLMNGPAVGPGGGSFFGSLEESRTVVDSGSCSG